ncbi:MAG: recombination protein RecR [Candidatus Doudnabacteria bacterium]|nr:recombination protein RecR [Candidatus Doudnabacteria bacterium]
MNLPHSLERAINEFSKLPGVGPKSAQRLVFYLLKREAVDLDAFAESVRKLQDGVQYCTVCHIMSDGEVCGTCSNTSRDHQLVCVVEESMDAIALDKSGTFRGVFHILGGVLNPMEGIGPDKLHVRSLLNRLQQAVTTSDSVREIIIATNPTLEGETTALHLSKLLRQEFPNITVTRIARGLPMGGDLEYADEVTLNRAMEGRREY